MTHVDTLRRYLQPSPTLRWHPWAPIVAGLLLIALAFMLGAQWGHSAAKREVDALGQYGYAAQVRMEQKSKYPARDAFRKAGAIDAAVAKFVRESREQPGTWQRFRAESERWMFRGGRELFVIPRASIVDLAEFRLRELSGAADAWQVTSSYCREMTPLPTGFDLRNEVAAEAYSTLLGRRISAEQLAPAVANARCEPSRRMQ
jgi:hypothetical protein